MRFLKLALASAFALGLVATGPANAADPVKIRVSWVAPVANWGSLLLEKKDLLTHYGKSYTLESTRFPGTPPMVQAIANNELEVASLAYSSLAIAIQNAGLDDLVIIADEFQDGVEGWYTAEYFVLKDSPIKDPKDMKGKIVATNAAGSAVDVATRAMLRKHGLEDKRDYTVIEAAFPTMLNMLESKKVDMIPGVLPFSLNPKLREVARPLYKQKDAIGVTQMIMWTARKSFIQKNRAAMVDFMEDSLRVSRWFQDPKNHEEVKQIAAKLTKQPAESFGWAFTKKDTYRDPNMLPNVEAIQKNLDMTAELGFAKGKIDVKKHLDLSLVQEAAKRLK